MSTKSIPLPGKHKYIVPKEEEVKTEKKARKLTSVKGKVELEPVAVPKKKKDAVVEEKSVEEKVRKVFTPDKVLGELVVLNDNADDPETPFEVFFGEGKGEAKEGYLAFESKVDRKHFLLGLRSLVEEVKAAKK